MKSVKQNSPPPKKRFLSFISYFGLWGMIAILLIPTLWQLKALILYLSLLMVESESFRPSGWNTSTLAGVDKCTTFLSIVIWLIGVMFAEGYIRESITQGKLLRQGGRMVLIVLGVYISTMIIFYLIG